MDKVKLKWEQFKSYMEKYDKKKVRVGAIGAGGIVLIAIIVALALNNVSYSTLFTGMTNDEAIAVVSKLQEMNVDYQYDGSGTILIDRSLEQSTRAALAMEGYPKSGFAYDIYLNNVSGMTTDSQNQQFEIFALQDRISATIREFSGVQNAIVSISLAEEEKYVLSQDDEENTSTGSAMVTMADGGSPSPEQVVAIQRLVASNVSGMEASNVVVIDGNGIEVSTNEEGGSSTSGDAGEDIASLIETEISKKVINVLSPFYGSENIRVSVRGQVNMERVIRETTTYTTPEKVDENDKVGILDTETETTDVSGTDAAATGVAGTEPNAEVPQYDNLPEGTENYSNTFTRDYLVNQVKEQGELDPGYLEDLTVSVSINSEALEEDVIINVADLTDLVGNATGIATADREEKITVVSAPFYTRDIAAGNQPLNVVGDLLEKYSPETLGLMALAILLALIILAMVLHSIRKKIKNRKKKPKRKRKGKKKKGEPDEDEIILVSAEEGTVPNASTKNVEVLDLQTDKTRELRENVRDFAEENPEISAQMIKNWLNGGDENGG